VFYSELHYSKPHYRNHEVAGYQLTLVTLHSFDPCMACAIHMVDADGNDLGETATGMSVCVS